jgi:hypothetical protein
LDASRWCGTRVGGFRRTSEADLNPLLNIQYSGKRKTSAKITISAQSTVQ